MSKAPGGVVEQAQRLVDCARLLPAGEGARALEQAVTMLQAAQTQLLVEAERCGELKDAGCHIHHTWWWALAGPTDLDLQLPLCGSHHRWVHDHGLTLTLHDGLLEFRDPKGRVITNTQQVLAGQLDLLHHQQAGSGPADNQTTGRAEHAEKLLAEAAADAEGWPDSPYRHGTWGWTGHNPAPPPGHGPPQAS
jgi:hypothetical protein